MYDFRSWHISCKDLGIKGVGNVSITEQQDLVCLLFWDASALEWNLLTWLFISSPFQDLGTWEASELRYERTRASIGIRSCHICMPPLEKEYSWAIWPRTAFFKAFLWTEWMMPVYLFTSVTLGCSPRTLISCSDSPFLQVQFFLPHDHFQYF
jgi:hypothetical protein